MKVKSKKESFQDKPVDLYLICVKIFVLVNIFIQLNRLREAF